jgi:hypothetical protein
VRLRPGLRLAIVRWAIDALPPRIQADGIFWRVEVARPGTWLLEASGFRLALTPDVLLLPTDSGLSMLLDIWCDAGAEVFSTSRLPDRP